MRRKRPAKKRYVIDKSVLAISEPKRVRDAAHRKFVATLPCCVTGKFPVDPAHISKNNHKAMASKVGDNHILPLHPEEHRKQHVHGELSYWGDALERAQRLALDLYELTGDREACVFRIMKFWRGQ